MHQGTTHAGTPRPRITSKIDPLPYDIATACYAIGTRVEVPAGAYLYRQGDTAEPERLRDVSSEHLALGPDV